MSEQLNCSYVQSYILSISGYHVEVLSLSGYHVVLSASGYHVEVLSVSGYHVLLTCPPHLFKEPTVLSTYTSCPPDTMSVGPEQKEYE